MDTVLKRTLLWHSYSHSQQQTLKYGSQRWIWPWWQWWLHTLAEAYSYMDITYISNGIYFNNILSETTSKYIVTILIMPAPREMKLWQPRYWMAPLMDWFLSQRMYNTPLGYPSGCIQASVLYIQAGVLYIDLCNAYHGLSSYIRVMYIFDTLLQASLWWGQGLGVDV